MIALRARIRSVVRYTAIAAGVLVLAGIFGGLFVMISGIVPIKASSGHWPITAALLDFAAMTPVLHVSGKYPAARHCAAVVLPIAPHPQIGTRVLACDLDEDPADWLDLAVDEIADRLYTPSKDLPEGTRRVPLKEIHLNRAPALVELTAVIAFANLTTRANVAFGIESDGFAEACGLKPLNLELSSAAPASAAAAPARQGDEVPGGSRSR